MKTALEKFISENENGLFLLDSPTGFGKTRAVIQILKDYLSGVNFSHVKRMFFVTSLKTNLPCEDLFELLSDDEKKKCLRLKAYDEDVILNWNTVKITINELKNSKEYRSLNADISILNDLVDEKNCLEVNGQIELVIKKQKAIDSFQNKIAMISEPAFRELIKKNHFYGKSSVDKKKFINENEWFTKLYPICELENKKVIFMTTAKFFAPINLFYRMPFYMYADNIIKEAVVFIDEFDSSKRPVLDQLIENSQKIEVDSVSLFTNIYYILQSQKFPERLLKMTPKSNENEDIEEKEFFSSEEILNLNKEKFKEIYEKHHFDKLIKSQNFKYKNAFLFDDGNYVTVYNDNSKKQLTVKEDEKEKINKLIADDYRSTNNKFAELLKDVYGSIKYFARGIKFLANNYYKYINTTKEGYEHKYSQEEALMTILNAFNLNGENRDYLRTILTDGRYRIEFSKEMTRKGFKFTEVEDSSYHDLQSVVHQFNFETTPENLIILMAQATRLVGISATASIETVIGNYDLNYIRKVLGLASINMRNEDKARIGDDFAAAQEIYKNVNINVEIIDDLDCFSNQEKAKLLLEKIYKEQMLQKYFNWISQDNADDYYNLIMVKLAYLYKEIAIKPIKSFIAFVNKLPRINDDKLDLRKLQKMFDDVCECNRVEKFNVFILQSDNFEFEMNKVYSQLNDGKKCFVISTYQTVGSGKNIQYTIPESELDSVIVRDKTRYQKDFDGIYLLTPTNLTQQLRKNAEDKHSDLIRYLYQQQCLYLNDKLTYGQYRTNIINGFRRTFFLDYDLTYFNKNSDLRLHTTQIIIQAVGRICRCGNKNKNIYIYTDSEIVDRIQNVKQQICDRLFNAEFLALMNTSPKNEKKVTVQEYSQKSKAAYSTISKNSNTVRSSAKRVDEWKALRDYVLKNPTADFIVDKYCELYFKFDSKHNGYSYKPDNNFNIVDIKLDTREDMLQVSAQDCQLPILLSVDCVAELFKTENYAHHWKSALFAMSPSLYNQVYKGALGEVVGKAILDKYLGYDVEEIQDYSLYELFDFKIKNIYIDFKNWKYYDENPIPIIEKIKRKLKRAKGEKAIIINIMKRGNHKAFENIDEDVIEIPYLINENNEVDDVMIETIDKYIIN